MHAQFTDQGNTYQWPLLCNVKLCGKYIALVLTIRLSQESSSCIKSMNLVEYYMYMEMCILFEQFDRTSFVGVIALCTWTSCTVYQNEAKLHMPPGQNGDCRSAFAWPILISWITIFYSFIGIFLTTIRIAFTNVIGAMLLKGDRSLGETYVCVQKQLLILIK